MKLKVRNVWWDDEPDHLGRTEVCRNKAVLVEDLRTLLKDKLEELEKEREQIKKEVHGKIDRKWFIRGTYHTTNDIEELLASLQPSFKKNVDEENNSSANASSNNDNRKKGSEKVKP